jgi:hypothetical protein
MPYIVENSDGISFESDIYITPTTFNFGTSSDVATSLTCSVYIERGGFSVAYSTLPSDLYVNSNFHINSAVDFPIQLLTTVSGGVSLVTEPSDHIIIASFSNTNNNDIWLGTSSRIEGKELIIRRVDGSTATVNIKSSQTDIDDGNVLTGMVSQLTLSNIGYYRFVRIGGYWTVMTWA